MFIVWGSKVTQNRLGYYIEECHCDNCNNTSNYEVIRVRKRFTLFWIPLFTISTKYYMCCPICGDSDEVPKKEVFKMLENNVLSENVTFNVIE